MSRLANIIDVEVFNDFPAVDSVESTAFFQSGVIARNQLLDNLANAAGKTAEMHYWKDIDPSIEPNYSNDNPADEATPLLIAQGEMFARKAFLNQGWSEADLAAELASGGNAMRRIRARIDAYWQMRWQRRLLASTIGLLNDNIAADGGDMVYDISLETTVGVDETNLLGRSAVVAAAFTMGDRFENLRTIAMHSVVAQRAIDNDEIDFIPDSRGLLTIPTYLGKRVVIDDSMPVIAGTTSGFRYVTVMFGTEAFGYGEGTPEVPTAVERKEAGANGGGVETLWSRKTWLIQPIGYSFTSNTVTGPAAPKSPANISPTDADLKLAVNWTRMYDRKLIPLAFLITNG